jgi:two-component system, chemotaxis family, response regulator Rcp1
MRTQPRKRTYQILLVEDNPGDARLLREALAEDGAPATVDVVRDGEEALLYLNREGKFCTAPRPDLIFLDLNLPRKDGRELLAEIKGSATLRRIPVVVLTTSDAEQDVLYAYDLHANSYVRKPVDLEVFFSTIRACQNYWLRMVRLPA